jgi:hypothetical protein
MAAPPPSAPLPVPFVQMAAAINAAFGGQLATVTDVNNAIAPLNAQMTALSAQVTALSAQVAALTAQMNNIPAVINTAIQVALVPHNAPAIAAAASASALAIALARAHNAHDRDGEDYAVVPRADGNRPNSWPLAGMDRSTLASLTSIAVTALLADYQLAPPLGLRARRNMLARHIGTPCV